MKRFTLPTFGAVLGAAFLAFLVTDNATAQVLASTSVDPSADSKMPFEPSLDLLPGVLFDEPGDGSLWALGSSWKASFGAQGATYFPRSGTAPSVPHMLSPESVTLGGSPLAFERVVPATHAGDRVEMNRGTFVEAYELGATSVEQLFVFSSLPRSGDLVLSIPIADEIQAAETDDGLEFRSGEGRVTYSRAVAIDARGTRASATTRVEGGSVVIRVDAGFLATAQMPLVIDPVLNAIFPDSTTSDTLSIDAAYDAFHGVWMVVYQQLFSGVDYDAYAKMYSSTGTLFATIAVDATTNIWVAPRIANLANAHQFLVVAGVTSGSVKSIKGRTVTPNGAIITQSPQFNISDTAGGKIRPDVGGDPYLGTSYYCVVWEYAVNEAIPVPDHRVAYQLVNSAGATVLPTAVELPTTAGGYDASPSVSKSNDESSWLIAWQHVDQLFHGDIYAAHVGWAGTLLDGPFTVFGGPGFEAPPCASSPIHGTNRYAIAWHTGISPNRDIRVAAIEGTTVLNAVNMTALEASGLQSVDQVEPSVDSDGTHFMVSYSEFDPNFLFFELKVTDLALAGDTLTIVQSHLTPQPGLGLSQRQSQIAAARTYTGTLAHRYLAVYDILQNSTDHDVAGRYIDGITGGSWNRFCFGDGSGTACPCGNTGAAMQGCANSVDSHGAFLEAIAGSPTATDTTVVLRAASLPPNAPCLFFQGTTAGAGVTFGDGLRCATGSVVRLDTGAANASGIATYPSAGDLPIITKGGVGPAGAMRTYQTWYRNAASFCTSATFNLTNGFQIFWAP